MPKHSRDRRFRACRHRYDGCSERARNLIGCGPFCVQVLVGRSEALLKPRSFKTLTAKHTIASLAQAYCLVRHCIFSDCRMLFYGACSLDFSDSYHTSEALSVRQCRYCSRSLSLMAGKNRSSLLAYFWFWKWWLLMLSSRCFKAPAQAFHRWPSW